MTDEELDRDWKPNGRRPQSTIARSFSQELVDIFRIENSVADLDEQVDKRKHQISSQATELEALEARIKEMEDRLKRQQPHGGSPRVQRPTVANAFGDVPPKVPDKDNELPASPSRLEHKHSSSRPATARAGQQAVPGALPPTPVASEVVLTLYLCLRKMATASRDR
ncbi:hypothetical protein NKR23_g3967 [Pleurostoma richardsiae]|uniref:Uncharacterized protein n=1 Tax=Pleurostoma richardsiae TaxID=41990 RepID=A0AA38RKI5_9PEZI|nr:hypothetical protein NKR23_g3967 [Pleurostoma richardsiae]